MFCEPIIKAGTKAPNGLKITEVPADPEYILAQRHCCTRAGKTSGLPGLVWTWRICRLAAYQKYDSEFHVSNDTQHFLWVPQTTCKSSQTASLRLSNALSIAMQAPSMYLQSNIFATSMHLFKTIQVECLWSSACRLLNPLQRKIRGGHSWTFCSSASKRYSGTLFSTSHDLNLRNHVAKAPNRIRSALQN